MKFVSDRKPLLDALSLAARLAERRSTIPILGHVKLAVGKGKVTVTGTNMDRVGSVDAAAAIAAPGETTVNAELLLNFVKNAVDGSQVELELDERGFLTVRAGRARATFHTLPAAEFPDISEGDFDERFEIPADQLAGSIGFVQHAVANEEARRFLCGIYLHSDDQGLVFASTDGFSLARRRVPIGADLTFDPPIIPREALDGIRNLAGDAKGDLTVEISKFRIRISGTGRRFSTKLIDGVYPSYEKIIPTDSPRRFSAGRVALEAAVTRCSALADNKDRTLRVETMGTTVRVSARSTDAGDIIDEIDAQAHGGDGHFNIHAVRMAQALSALNCPDVDVEFGNELPIVFRNPANPDDLQVVGAQKG